MESLKDLQTMVCAFRDDRNWKQFHTPKNLAMALGSEVGELQDLYLWDRHPNNLLVLQEMADILIYLLSMADVTQIDLYEAVINKVAINCIKYPVDKYKGNCEKSK